MQAEATLLRDWIDRAAQRAPGKPWIVLAEDGRTVTYGELRQATGRIAAFLHGRGLGANHSRKSQINGSSPSLIASPP